jgi:hypothetical protein
MDTGVSYFHPELFSLWRGETNSWYDPNNQHLNEAFDSNDHWTQTLGIMPVGKVQP